MSVNFGYGGYGMMNGMGMTNGMQGSGGNVFREVKEQYGCDRCYQYGPTPYNYQMQVNALPPQVTNPGFFSRLIKRITA